MEYELEDVLKECQILVAHNKTAMKKRERTYLDKRNYLIGLLNYKYGKSSVFIGDMELPVSESYPDALAAITGKP